MEFNQTVINPLALLITIVMCIIILFIKKERMTLPLILVVCFITQLQRIVIVGIDLPMVRVILITGFLRIIFSRDKFTINVNSIDKIIICFIIFRTILNTILWSSVNTLIFMLGQGVEILGTYFLVRLTINDLDDYDIIIKTIIIASIPMAVFMIIEQTTGGRNYFSIFGGVPEFNLIREGKLRAQGAFSHPILAGTYGALLLPLSWGIWQKGERLFPVIGISCAFIIVLASSSSGPIATLGASFFGIFFWIFNKYTKNVRRLFFLTIILLHLGMKAPVWHLISRIDLVGGSTGYHRFRLIDAAVHNFFGWFLLGIKDTGVWGRQLFDITNQYILEGTRGGIIPLILFITMIVKGFQTIGTARSVVGDNIILQKYIWAFGVILFAHTVTFISVSYFGQMVIFYYLHLGMISNLNSLTAKTDNKIVCE